MFAVCYERNVMDNTRLVEVNPYFKQKAVQMGFYSERLIEKIAQSNSIADIPEVPESIRKIFVTTVDISPEWHVRMQAAFQKIPRTRCQRLLTFPIKHP
jgi:ribonucleoside-diphosphate reductase alpha chain